MEEELKTNAVKLSPEEQYQIRKSIVRLSKSGKKNGEIAEIVDVSERHVRSIKKQYAEGGLAALKPKKRGRSVGEKRILTSEQEKEIQTIIVECVHIKIASKIIASIITAIKVASSLS